MDALHDFLRSDTQLSSLPEHLRYKPFTVPNPCPAVEPRYLQPRKPAPTPPPLTFRPETNSGATSRVQPRYLTPRAHTPPPKQLPQYHEQPEYDYHKRVAKAAGFGAAAPRLLDPMGRLAVKDGDLSPRDRVQQQREENKRLLSWRANAINGPSRTFDEIRLRNQSLVAAFEQAMLNKKNKTPSVVGDYCRHGTPVKHHTTSEQYVSKRKKNFDPKWVAGGGSGGGRWVRGGDKGPINRSTARSESRVREYRAQSADRKVSRANVPRVAKLAPSYSLQRWESEMSAAVADSPSSAANGHASPAPTRPGTNGGAKTPNDHVEVLQGPVTVSVPRGAVIRIGSAAASATPPR
jgi:hypothetical protein